MRTSYETLPALAGVYLEDSYVLAINEDARALAFRLEAVLTPRHPLYRDPRPGEQYCYVNATLTFSPASRIEWTSRTGTSYRDASDEEDQGNIDYLESENGEYHLGGDWGEVRVWSPHPPAFQVLHDG